MGIDVHAARCLFYARKIRVDFGRTATIGRQGLFLDSAELDSVAKSFGETFDIDQLNSIFGRYGGYADGLFIFFGAKDVQSFDISNYEAATYIHDFNYSIPERFHENYSAVIDGGSLEHVFNFPTAIRSCMEMIQIGGHYIGFTPANNFFGHGFYQFSPELFFNVFSEENGFKVVSMIACEDRPKSQWFLVKNPRDVSSRVTLCNSVPTLLLIVAKRIARRRIFATPPQQSDYTVIWRKLSSATAKEPQADADFPLSGPLLIRLMKNVLPRVLRQRVKLAFSEGIARTRSRPVKISRAFSPGKAAVRFDPRFFRPFNPVVD
jgi:hypothetical protein